MRFDRDRLVFLALGVLMRAALDTREQPAKPGPDVRLALAVLFGFSRSGERAPYDEFWRCLRDPYAKEFSDAMRGYRRKREATALLRRITRDVGASEQGEYQNRLSDLVVGPPKHRWRPGSAFGASDKAS